MLNTPVRTTIEIPPDILYHAKLRALKEEKTLKEIIWESLKKYLNLENARKLSSFSSLPSSRITEPRISKKKYLANLKKIKGVLWTKEDDIARKKMEEKEKWW